MQGSAYGKAFQLPPRRGRTAKEEVSETAAWMEQHGFVLAAGHDKILLSAGIDTYTAAACVAGPKTQLDRQFIIRKIWAPRWSVLVATRLKQKYLQLKKYQPKQDAWVSYDDHAARYSTETAPWRRTVLMVINAEPDLRRVVLELGKVDAAIAACKGVPIATREPQEPRKRKRGQVWVNGTRKGYR